MTFTPHLVRPIPNAPRQAATTGASAPVPAPIPTVEVLSLIHI